MHLNNRAVLVCFAALVFCRCSLAEIHFMDCGSENISIDSVNIENCDDNSHNCYLRRGQTYEIVITPASLEPQIDYVYLDVKALIRGALFNISAKFAEPCGLPCPIVTRVVTPNIPINVEIAQTLLRGPAPIIINATYMNGSLQISHFCLEFEVYIW